MLQNFPGGRNTQLVPTNKDSGNNSISIYITYSMLSGFIYHLPSFMNEQYCLNNLICKLGL